MSPWNRYRKNEICLYIAEDRKNGNAEDRSRGYKSNIKLLLTGNIRGETLNDI